MPANFEEKQVSCEVGKSQPAPGLPVNLEQAKSIQGYADLPQVFDHELKQRKVMLVVSIDPKFQLEAFGIHRMADNDLATSAVFIRDGLFAYCASSKSWDSPPWFTAFCVMVNPPFSTFDKLDQSTRVCENQLPVLVIAINDHDPIPVRGGID